MAAPEVVPRPITDEQLIEQIRAGDQDAFRAIYDRYFRRIYHFVDKRLRNRADTEETVQEVFCSVFSSLHTFRGEAPFAAWMFGLTRRTLANRFKKKQHPTVSLDDDEPDRLDPASGSLQREPTPHEAYEFQERVARLEHVVTHKLNEDQRELFRLHHLQHQSIQDIARSQERSEDSVKSHLYRARRMLLAR